VLHDLEPVFERPGGLLEAPRLSADGAVVFSDVNGGGVYRDGEPVVPKRRGVGGIVPHRDGGLVITGRTLLHGDRELHAADDLAGYNDLTTTPDGHVLVGALRFRPLAGEEPVPSPLLRVTGPGQAHRAERGRAVAERRRARAERGPPLPERLRAAAGRDHWRWTAAARQCSAPPRVARPTAWRSTRKAACGSRWGTAAAWPASRPTASSTSWSTCPPTSSPACRSRAQTCSSPPSGRFRGRSEVAGLPVTPAAV
jgi:hypothetical protein